jgi:hypothetical protein
MGTFVCAVSAMSVALLYSSWHAYFLKTVQRNQLLRERVTYMLWVMANKVTEGKPLSLPEL